ncbi:MAG: hypothetical protein KTV77_02925 [Wolbachia endosymbiont of Fragariocoptes setiger]|nr:hypothetical protein [Wolbachia endosymbiont of Fragariocoptes setiger]
MKFNTQNTLEEIKKKHKELLIQLKKFNEILEEIKLANNNTQAITTACEILKITNISDENFLKKPNKTKKEIRDRLKELGKYSSIAKEKYKHFTNIWCDSIKQKLQNPSLQEDQRNETPKEIVLAKKK